MEILLRPKHFDYSKLDRCVRWISKTLDQEEIGRALPSTCEPEGYCAEYEKGNVKTIVAKGSFTARMQVGYLDNNFAAQKCVEIDQLMDNKQ